MMKKKLFVLLTVILVLSMALFVACGKETVKPDLKNLVVDVTDTPETLDLGTYTLKEVYLDNDDFSDYTVKNGQFSFTFTTYGALGEGTHEFRLVFAEEELKWNITVTDRAKPNYSVKLEPSYSFGFNQKLQLPTVTRNDEKSYDIRYTLSQGSVKVFEKTNLEKESETFDLGKLQPGSYNIKIEVLDKGTTIDSKTADILIRKEKNYAAAESLLEDAKVFSYTPFLDISFDVAKNAIAIERLIDDIGMGSRFVFSSSIISEEINAGANVMTMTYSIQGEGTGSFSAVEYATEDEFDSGEIVRTYVPESDTHNKWITKKFRISELADGNYFVFLPRHEKGETVYLKEIFLEQYNADQLISEDGLELWETDIDSSLSLSWSESMLKIERVKEMVDFSLSSEYAFINLDWFRAWRDAGKTAVEFEVKANDILANTPDAFTLSVVDRKAVDVQDSESVVFPAYGSYDVKTTDSTTKIYIDLEALLSLNENAEELAVSVNGEKGGILYIKGITFAESDALRTFDSARYADENYAASVFGWKYTSGQFISLTYDNGKAALKAVVNETIDPQYYNSTNAKFYISAHDLLAAKASGHKYLKFSYQSNTDGLVFRIFNNTDNDDVIVGGVPRIDAKLLGMDRAFFTEKDVWKTGYVSLEHFFNLEQSEGIFAFGICGEKDTALWIKDICFASKSEYETDLLAQNVFSEDNVANWNRFSNNGVTISYDSAEGAMLFVPSGTDGINGRHYSVYYESEILRTLYANGTPAVTFEIKINDLVAGNPAYGLRFFGETEFGHTIDTGAPSTSYVYADYLSTELSTSTYTTVWIDLAGFLQNDFEYFGFVVSGAAGSQFWIRNLTAKTQEEYDEYRKEQIGQILSSQNFADKSLWASAAAYHLTVGYKDAESTLTIKMNNEWKKTLLSGRLCYIYMPASPIKNLYNSYRELGGAKYLKFSYRVVNPSENEFAAMRLAGNKNPNDFSGTYSVYYAKSEWQTAVISLDEFFSMPDYKEFFTFFCVMSENATIEIKDIKFATEEENKDYIDSVNIIAKEEYAYFTDADGNFNAFGKHGNNWKIDDPYYLRGSEDTDGSVKWSITSGYTGGLNQTDFVIYYSASYLKQAMDAGFTKLTFEVKADESFSTNPNGGIRIFAKETPVRSTVSIDTNPEQGIWKYKDVTFTEAGVYQTVEIVLADFLATDGATDANWLAFVLGGPNGSSVNFRNFTLVE